MAKPIRIGTRNSPLALWQAQKVADELTKKDIASEFVFVRTQGDIDENSPLTSIGGVGVFTRALDQALLLHQCDIAVHSLKDLPTIPARGVDIFGYLKREDPRDVLVIGKNSPWRQDPNYPAKIGTSSNRRKGVWLSRYPHHQVVDIRGNVETRLRKVEEGQYDGTILAAAGLIRLGLTDVIHEYLDWMIPAPGQGVIAVAAREKDSHILEQVKSVYPLHDIETHINIGIERGFLHFLDGGCSAPVGAYAYFDQKNMGYICFRSQIASLKLGEPIIEVNRDIFMYSLFPEPEKTINFCKQLVAEALAQGAGPRIAEHRRSKGI
jgi:hydroxymethylbilane synthase